MKNFKFPNYVYLDRQVMRQIPNFRQGFTLIEILVAIAILGIVFGLAISSIPAIGKKSRDQQRIADLQSIQGALAQYYADNGFYPETNGVVKAIFAQGGTLTDATGNPNLATPTKTYLKVPTDPNGAYCYDSRSTFSGFGCCNNINASSCPPGSSPPSGSKTCQVYLLGALMEESKYNEVGACGNLANFYVSPQKSGS